jgi:hypothetical protein
MYIKDGVSYTKRSCGIKWTHIWFDYMFLIDSYDKTALNTLLDNVYYKAKKQYA